ncbi:hypothetical protein [Ascidiimonas aurantiaca]|uniref:hypothetical protein n=1 Tax=Ascidiimonas aurantiaca TaxID=1685432 RepID=UPI0030ED05EC
MKKMYSCMLLILTIAVLSCNFSEELYLNEDGSGRMSIKFDGSELLQMQGTSSTDKEGGEKPMDSVISFSKLLEDKKDSIAHLSPQEQARLQKLEPFFMHVLMNEKTKEMKLDLYTDFTSVSELSDVFGAFQNASAFGMQGARTNESADALNSGDATEISYTLSKNVFKRTAKVLDYELLQRNIDSLGRMETFLSSSKYTLTYHFPKKIKSVSVKEAQISEDGKTLVYEVPFMDFMNNPEILNIEVILEN